RWLRSRVTANTASIGEDSSGEKLVLAGVLSGVRRIITKRKDTMLVAQLEDLHGSVEIVVFPRTLERPGDVWHEGGSVSVGGKSAQKRRGTAARAVRQPIGESVEVWTPPEPGAEPPPDPAEEEPLPMPTPAAPAWATVDLATEDDDAPPEVPVPPSPVEPVPVLGRLIHLRFVRIGDDAADLERLRSLYALLAHQSGPDRFELIVVHGGAQHR